MTMARPAFLLLAWLLTGVPSGAAEALAQVQSGA